MPLHSLEKPLHITLQEMPAKPWALLTPFAFQITSGNLKDRYWRVVEEKYPSKKLQALDNGIGRVIDLYAILYTNVGVLGRYNNLWQGKRASTCLSVVVNQPCASHDCCCLLVPLCDAPMMTAAAAAAAATAAHAAV